MRRLINTLCVALFVSHPPGTMAQAQWVRDDAQPPGTTFLCRYTDGPRAGGTEPLSVAFDAATVRAGSSCSDGISSTGVVVAQAGAHLASANGRDAAATRGALTGTCQFSSGPRAGEIAELPGAPFPVGSACSDGASSAGTAIIAPAGAAAMPWSSPIQGSTGGRKSRSARFVSSCPAPRLMGGTTMPRCPPRRSAAHVGTARAVPASSWPRDTGSPTDPHCSISVAPCDRIHSRICLHLPPGAR